MALRTSLARKLFRNIQVHRLDEAFMTDLLPTHKLRDSGLETHRITPEVKISVSKFPGLGEKREFAVRIKNVNFTTNKVTVRRFKIKRFTKQDIRIRTLQKFFCGIHTIAVDSGKYLIKHPTFKFFGGR